ncbi:MAG: 6-carboxytetrahydropterin synthase [Bacteroidia bacterium]|nr:6-carboxytetrahydropterin synthase [Bacteroidia bacterium]
MSRQKTQVIRLTQEFTFEMAHALDNYNGPCRNIHGHSYKLSVTVKGKPIDDAADNNNGMVVDFGVLKKIVDEHIISRYDHALVLNNASYLAGELKNRVKEKIIWTDYQPTCENMLLGFVELVKKSLPVNITLHSVRLKEAPGSFADWYAEDNA